MKNKKIMDILKSKNIVIPLYLYKSYSKLNVNLEEFILPKEERRVRQDFF